ncbi:histamine H2 receptor-like isoform X1 [Montipora capricornis]|uniref:histamine H2 receptor-like isoform X1 n=1 Tax=Montipora capricornis TaxID=246305 RepID=UPI0035F2086D
MVFGSHVCDQRAPLELSLTTTIVTAILCLITVPGNMLICWVVVKDPNKELRYSQFNCLVLNLAIADLITGLITEPLFVAFHIKEFQGKQAMDNFAIIHVAYFISCTSSLLSISSLATERYLSVTSKYRRIYSQSKMVIWSVLIWISSIAVSFVYFAVGFYKFVFVFSNIIVIATFCAIIYAYIRIYQSLHAQGHVTAENDRFMDRRIRYEKRATRSFLLVLIVFICCNLSSCAMVYVILLCDVCRCYVIHWLRDFQFLTALVNCAANQFLYAWRMPSFVRAFKRSFHRTVVSTRSGENPSDLQMCAYARNSSLETHTSQTRTLTLNLNG